MLARPAEEITPENLQVWTHPDDRGTRVLREEFDQERRQSYDVEKRYVRGDGETIWCRVVVENVRRTGREGRRSQCSKTSPSASSPSSRCATIPSGSHRSSRFSEMSLQPTSISKP